MQMPWMCSASETWQRMDARLGRAPWHPAHETAQRPVGCSCGWKLTPSSTTSASTGGVQDRVLRAAINHVVQHPERMRAAEDVAFQALLACLRGSPRRPPRRTVPPCARASSTCTQRPLASRAPGRMRSSTAPRNPCAAPSTSSGPSNTAEANACTHHIILVHGSTGGQAHPGLQHPPCPLCPAHRAIQ
jgi:hypothetical protein